MPKRSRHSKPNRHERNTDSGHGRGNSEPQAIGSPDHDQSATVGTNQGGPTTISSKQDQQLLTMLGKHDEWQMPQELFVSIPNDLKLMITQKDEDGEFTHSPSDRKWAMNQARMLTRDNWQRDKAAIHIHQRNEFMATRHTRAETPEVDTEDSNPIVDAVAFTEKVSRDEMVDAATQLQQLGLLPLLLDQPSKSK